MNQDRIEGQSRPLPAPEDLKEALRVLGFDAREDGLEGPWKMLGVLRALVEQFEAAMYSDSKVGVDEWNEAELGYAHGYARDMRSILLNRSLLLQHEGMYMENAADFLLAPDQAVIAGLSMLAASRALLAAGLLGAADYGSREEQVGWECAQEAAKAVDELNTHISNMRAPHADL
ncbi:hypothetical protein ACIG3E_33270 [Streptomyces sp. NPDC053474]|uniref:hypothetical protein n=1 Tax=Streptomyces sp. NPDC053474 TaxID=3365704 RepID=UPI0037D671DA